MAPRDPRGRFVRWKDEPLSLAAVYVLVVLAAELAAFFALVFGLHPRG